MASTHGHKNFKGFVPAAVENKVNAPHKQPSVSGLPAMSPDWIRAIVSIIFLATGLIFDTYLQPTWYTATVRFGWYCLSYLPVGLPVLLKGIKLAFKGEIFTEFILMSLATLGAFYIGEYPEGAAVMLFYTIGELFQAAAVNRAKRSIKSLMDVRPDTAQVLRDNLFVSVDPTEVNVNDTIQVKVGERVPLDGVIINESSSFNTAALTGESTPSLIEKGETVLAGMINESNVVQVKVSRLFAESSLARILTLVQNATGRKAKTELFIRRFAKAYTPIVVLLALALTFLPYFFLEVYDFNQWLYRALIFLVISCPCALVVAIPLGYFGGIGAGSRNGILFKGSSYLDRMVRVGVVVMDKTGTLTEGVFKVQETKSKTIGDEEWLVLARTLESQSNHPVAKAIVAYVGSSNNNLQVENVEEFKGYGVKGTVEGKAVMVGNLKLFEKFNIKVDDDVKGIASTVVIVAVDNVYRGYLIISDQLKSDARQTIETLHSFGIHTVMLSGDRSSVVADVAKQLNIAEAYGDLLPEDKVTKFESIKRGKKEAVAFVGDGINDAPVLTISDVGIAMGGLGSDAAIETADVVIQTDQPSKIITAIKIGKATNQIVWQNIALAFGVKVIVMSLGAWGVASMWEAVFADVGVALLAIFNAIRIQHMKFN